MMHHVAEARDSARRKEARVKIHANDAPRPGDVADLIIRQIPGMRRERTSVRVRGDHRRAVQASKLKNLAHSRVRGVRYIDDAPGLHDALDEIASGRGETCLARAVATRRCRERIVRGVHQPEEPDPSSDPPGHRVRVSGERRGTLERQPGTHRVVRSAAAGHRIGRRRRDEREQPSKRRLQIFSPRSDR